MATNLMSLQHARPPSGFALKVSEWLAIVRVCHAPRRQRRKIAYRVFDIDPLVLIVGWLYTLKIAICTVTSKNNPTPQLRNTIVGSSHDVKTDDVPQFLEEAKDLRLP